ncbi:MAG: tetratricopeptide repeat protein [Treponema sp.]|nr:tetratricopeptide repeat protein [Treponema sp.]
MISNLVKIKKVFSVFNLLMLLVICSCSTSPKSTGDVYNLRAYAEKGLEAANKETVRGNYKNAHSLLIEYKRMAILSDDLSLITRVCLSMGNVLYSLGEIEEAFGEWDKAALEAQKSNNSELLSASKIFRAKGSLLSGRTGAQAVLDEVNRESVNIKKDALLVSFSWQVKGLALRALGSYAEAENALKQSLAIHEKKKTLENASYDWYTIASIRSLAGNTSGALEALDAAIVLDRRIENSWGLAASYRAMGDVYRKAGREKEALEAYARARGIYTALRNDDEIMEIEKKMRN